MGHRGSVDEKLQHPYVVFSTWSHYTLTQGNGRSIPNILTIIYMIDTLVPVNCGTSGLGLGGTTFDYRDRSLFLRYHIDSYQYVEKRSMQNLFTIEHQARIVIDDRRAEARHHARLALARSGQAKRDAASLLPVMSRMRTRVGGAVRHERATGIQTTCQPCVAC